MKTEQQISTKLAELCEKFDALDSSRIDEREAMLCIINCLRWVLGRSAVNMADNYHSGSLRFAGRDADDRLFGGNAKRCNL